jgi:hypothetical protein
MIKILSIDWLKSYHTFKLNKFKETIDFNKVGQPKSLNIITFGGILHKRKDGINIIPLWALKS